MVIRRIAKWVSVVFLGLVLIAALVATSFSALQLANPLQPPHLYQRASIEPWDIHVEPGMLCRTVSDPNFRAKYCSIRA